MCMCSIFASYPGFCKVMPPVFVGMLCIWTCVLQLVYYRLLLLGFGALAAYILYYVVLLKSLGSGHVYMCWALIIDICFVLNSFYLTNFFFF